MDISKEAWKLKVDLNGVNLEKLYAHELIGLYLLGKIRIDTLCEHLGQSYPKLLLFLEAFSNLLSLFSKKDESKVEPLQPI